MSKLPFAGLSLSLAVFCFCSTAGAQNPPVDESGHVVDFARDIMPILRDKCLECHGPEDAKNDFRVDDAEMMGDYIEAGDVESSFLYTDYIAVAGDDFADYVMPPINKGGPLPPHEIALIRLWITEGAQWPEGVSFATPGEGGEQAAPAAEAPQKEKGIAKRVWLFQGAFHPATVHFPVALFLFGGIFVVLGYKWPQLAHPIPIACLIGGAVSSVGASLMGMAFSEVEGYGFWFKNFGSTVTRHGLYGIALTVSSIVFSIIAIRAEMKDSAELRKIWRGGLLMCAMLVGLVGHVGGELTYPKLYDRAFAELTGAEEGAEPEDEAKPQPEAGQGGE